MPSRRHRARSPAYKHFDVNGYTNIDANQHTDKHANADGYTHLDANYHTAAGTSAC